MLAALPATGKEAAPETGRGKLDDDLLGQLIDPSLWLIDVKDVSRVTSLSRTTIWRKTKDQTFPQPVALGEAKRAWRVGVVQTWLEQQK